jgi:hypothetical protein
MNSLDFGNHLKNVIYILLSYVFIVQEILPRSSKPSELRLLLLGSDAVTPDPKRETLPLPL